MSGRASGAEWADGRGPHGAVGALCTPTGRRDAPGRATGHKGGRVPSSWPRRNPAGGSRCTSRCAGRSRAQTPPAPGQLQSTGSAVPADEPTSASNPKEHMRMPFRDHRIAPATGSRRLAGRGEHSQTASAVERINPAFGTAPLAGLSAQIRVDNGQARTSRCCSSLSTAATVANSLPSWSTTWPWWTAVAHAKRSMTPAARCCARWVSLYCAVSTQRHAFWAPARDDREYPALRLTRPDGPRSWPSGGTPPSWARRRGTRRRQYGLPGTATPTAYGRCATRRTHQEGT